METKQTAPEPISEKNQREQIAAAKREFRLEQRKLSFDEKMQIAFGLYERDEQLRNAVKK